MSDAIQLNLPDFGPYLNVTEDGYLWWPLKAAVRMAAGYQVHIDDIQALEPELRAPSKRVLANERTLIGAFGDARLGIAKPITFERDGFRFVDAAGFLTWLSQYISLKQPNIEFPDTLAEEVRIALAKAATERPHQTMSEPIESLRSRWNRGSRMRSMSYPTRCIAASIAKYWCLGTRLHLRNGALPRSRGTIVTIRQRNSIAGPGGNTWRGTVPSGRRLSHGKRPLPLRQMIWR